MSKFSILLAALLAGALLLAQTPVEITNESPGYYLSGEHFPLVYEGSGLIRGAAHPCTTAWVQVGWSDIAAAAANRNTARFNPGIFTAGLKTSCWGAGDSAEVATARFETAWDTTAPPAWNGDSSNVFVAAGAYYHPDYGTWRFESLADTSRTYLLPLRVLTGGYFRLILASGLEDTCAVDWRIVGEN